MQKSWMIFVLRMHILIRDILFTELKKRSWLGVQNLFDTCCWVFFIRNMILRFNIQHNSIINKVTIIANHVHVNPTSISNSTSMTMSTMTSTSRSPNANANIKIISNTNSPKLEMICTTLCGPHIWQSSHHLSCILQKWHDSMHNSVRPLR